MKFKKMGFWQMFKTYHNPQQQQLSDVSVACIPSIWRIDFAYLVYCIFQVIYRLIRLIDYRLPRRIERRLLVSD